MNRQLAVAPAELEGLDGLWQTGLGDLFDEYLQVGPPQAANREQVALAAALVETALEMQGLGGRSAPAPQLLLADLCLARASRLLAETADQGLQVGFARAVEEASGAAAAGTPMPPTRLRLRQAIEERA